MIFNQVEFLFLLYSRNIFDVILISFDLKAKRFFYYYKSISDGIRITYN